MSFHYNVLVRCPGGRNELQYVRGFFILGSGGGVLTFINDDNSANFFSVKKRFNLAFPGCLFFEKLYAKKLKSNLVLVL